MILGCVLALANVPISLAQQLKWSDPNYKPASGTASDLVWYQITETKAWTVKDGATMGLKGVHCMATLDKFRAAGIPDTRIIDVKYGAPEFKRGLRSLTKIRSSCAHVESLGKLEHFER